MKLKVFVLSVVLLLSAGMAMAQYTYPVNPNPTKFQTTFYSNDQFLATFNSSVTVTIEQKNTSTDTIYQSFNHGVVQAISVRIIDHDIPVDVSSSDFYMNNDPLDTPITVTYAYRQFTFSGSVFSKRTRAIIVNAREVIFVTQIAAMSYDDQNEWFDFEYSLRVR